MKTASAALVGKEEASERQPVELFRIWRDGGEEYRYTSGDAAVTYDGKVYRSASIKRTAVTHDSDFTPSRMKLHTAIVADPVTTFLSENPLEVYWVEVTKLFRDMSPYEAVVVFLGYIQSVSFKGNAATASCVGLEAILDAEIPRYKFQPYCNNFLYETKCTVVKATYKETIVLGAVDSGGANLTAAAFGDQPDGYFKHGYIVFGSHERLVVKHVGTIVTIRYPITFVTLEAGSTIDIYPGCDGTGFACAFKFDNIDNFFGHLEIPTKNPVLKSRF